MVVKKFPQTLTEAPSPYTIPPPEAEFDIRHLKYHILKRNFGSIFVLVLTNLL